MSEKIYCFKFKNRRGLIFLKTDQPYDPQKLFRGEVVVDDKFDAYIFKGTTYNPYAHLPDPHNLAISTKWVEVLKENGITGWRTYPLSIKDSKFEYFGLQILGRAGAVRRPPTTGYTNGINVDMSQWDGSDMFCAEGTFRIFFTEKVKNALLTAKILSPEEFEDISQVEWYSVAS